MTHDASSFLKQVAFYDNIVPEEYSGQNQNVCTNGQMYRFDRSNCYCGPVFFESFFSLSFLLFFSSSLRTEKKATM